MQITVIIVTVIFLAVLAWMDIKTKTVSVAVIAAMGLWLLITGGLMKLPLQFMLLGCIPGVIALFITFITKGKLGKGDGLTLLALGIGCGLESIMLVWAIALIMAAVFGMVLLVMKKATRKTELPFVPFLFWGYVICQWING